MTGRLQFGCVLYSQPCDPAHITGCDPEEDYFRNLVRHAPDFGQSTLAMPSNPDLPLQPVAYQVDVASLRPDNSPGSAVPHVTAVIKLDVSAILDLHFHFLDLTDHPCNDSFGALVSDIPNDRLTAASAQAAGPFQAEFLKGRDALKDIFVAAGIAFGTLTYDDILDHPDLDGLDIADTGSLFALSTYPIGINIYFVRTVSPIGLQAFGPNPGPAGLAGTRQSGIVIGVDTLCYRSWTQLARLTAHEIARYMGLYHNVEAESGAHPNWIDPIADDDADNANNNNLMFFSDAPPLVVGGQGPGIHLSPQQSDILTRSAVLR